MRASKNNKGVIAYLVLVVGLVMLGGNALLAQALPKNSDKSNSPLEPRPTSDDFPLPPAKTEALPLPPGKINEPLPPPENVDGLPAPPTKIEPPPSGRVNSGMPPALPQKTEPSPRGRVNNGMPPAFRGTAEDPPSRGNRASGKFDSPDDQIPTRRKAGNQNQPNSRASRQQNKGNSSNEADIFRVVPQTCVPAKGHFVWNFEEEELINILRQVSDLLCKTIVVNDAIGKNMKMTIIGKSPLTPRDAWDVLMASLAAKGMAMIEQGKTWTVIKRADSKSYPTPTYAQGDQARRNEEIGTLFYKAQHASQDALKNVAKVLITKDGMVESIGDQFIIVIDSNSNIRRLGNIFAQVDVEDAINKVHIIALHNADAKTVEKQLRELFDISSGGARGRRRPPGAPAGKSTIDIDKIIADERTNSLIVVTDNIDKVTEVVSLIDQPENDKANKGKIHVKKLKFADAKKIAETLTAVVQQGKGGSRFPRRRPDEATNELFEGEVKITAHEGTNMLVTVASAADYRSLLATINKLDVKKEQVYVEAVILDITVGDTNSVGINLFSGLDGGGLGLGAGSLGVLANPGGVKIADGIKNSMMAGAAGTNIPGLGSNSVGALAVLGNFLTGGVAGLVGPPATSGSPIPSFGAVLQALSTSSNIDVLSTPYLLTTDNTEAVMSVGQKVPVIKGASTMGSGGIGSALGVPIQNVVHEDVKLTFKVTPHVGADDNVRLDIDQEVNELGLEETILNAKQYRFNTKSAKTTIVLKDQQTGVIGGLINHSSKTEDNKVPFLGDIPILGWLFKNRTSKNDRKSLLLIITPYVIKSDDDYRKIIDRKLKEREEFARLYYGGKIKDYNPHVDYDKRSGPVSTMLLQVDSEMKKAENGGPGDGDEVIIRPNENKPEASKQDMPSINLNDQPKNSGETAYLDEENPFKKNDFLMEEFDANGEINEELFVPEKEAEDGVGSGN